MANLPQRLQRPLAEITSFLEKVPDGLTFDVLESKVQSVATLKKKDRELLLEHMRERGRIMVMDVTSGGKNTFPHLRHKLHISNSTLTNSKEERQALPQKEEFDPTKYVPVTNSEPRVGNRVVYTSAPQRTIPTRFKRKVHNLVEEFVTLETTPVETHIAPANQEPTMNTTTSLPTSNTYVPQLPTRLVQAAHDVMAYLKERPEGATLTLIGNKVVSYHRLKGSDRKQVIAWLASSANASAVKKDLLFPQRSATVIMHSDFQKEKVMSEFTPKSGVLDCAGASKSMVDDSAQEPVTGNQLPTLSDATLTDLVKTLTEDRPEKQTILDIPVSNPTVPSSLRAQAKALLAAADQMEQAQLDEINNQLTPIKLAMEEQIAVATELLEKQIDVMASMTDTLNKLKALTLAVSNK